MTYLKIHRHLDGEKQPLHARIVPKGTVDKEEGVSDLVLKFTGIKQEVYWQEPWKPFAKQHGFTSRRLNVEMGNFQILLYIVQCPGPVKDKQEIRAASVQM